MAATIENIIGENKTDFMGRGSYVWWMGEVEDKDDPLHLGRVKVRVLGDRKSTRLNSSHVRTSRMPSSA